jgi:hypothetical protein
VIVGKSIFGNKSTPSEKNENAPTTVNDKINIVAKTGRLTQISANHCIAQKKFQVSGSKFQVPSSRLSFRFQVFGFRYNDTDSNSKLGTWNLKLGT